MHFSSNSEPSNNQRCVILEIFAGSCRLSRACRELGFDVTAIDKDVNRAENFKVMKCDITNADDFSTLTTYIEADKEAILHSHFAPSCGTASRARERDIPGLSPHEQPRPLRSDSHPDGLPALKPHEAKRVLEANNSYDAMCRLILMLVQLGCSVSIENPKRSLFWATSFVRTLLQKIAGHFTYFHHCMHGGDRDKETAWWSFNPRTPTVDLFGSLALSCDKTHKHAAWRPYRDTNGKMIFPTASEAAYPKLLCLRVAHILLTEAQRLGRLCISTLDEQLQVTPDVAKRQLFTGQPRAQKLRPLVSEFGSYVTIFASLNDEPSLEAVLKTLPKGTKVCHRAIIQGGVSSDDKILKDKKVQTASGWKPSTTCEKFCLGIPREPEDFIRDAVKKGHPRDIIATVPESIDKLIDDLIQGDQQQRFEKRASFMKRWLHRSLELKIEEQRLHEGLPAHLQKILAGKRLLLLREILESLGYPDVAIVDDICSGFKLTGMAPKTGVFDVDVRKPQLLRMAPGFNAAAVGSLEQSADTTHDQKVWDETLQEVERGWIEPTDQVQGCLIAKRFPVPQKNKVRMIDDFSICGVNAAYGMRERLRVQSVDEITAYLAKILDKQTGFEPLELCGRTFDLKSAYKQYGVDPWHKDHLRIAVRNPAGGVAYFKVLSLPFGATGSVTSFLRLASAVTFIGIHGLGVIWTNFFDDFTVVGRVGEESNVTFYIESLFRLLGIWFASEGDKAPPFDPCFKTLGLQMDVSKLRRGTFSIGHTESRLDELVQTIRSLSCKACVNPKELERLHGRLVWFRSFVFGRRINSLVGKLSKLSMVKQRIVPVDSDMKTLFKMLETKLLQSKPAVVSRSLCKTWFVFTDGAFEPDNTHAGTVGGVLVSPEGIPVEVFGEAVPLEYLNIFKQFSLHPIYELEILPVLMAVALWGQHLAKSMTVFFLDNEAARSGLIRGVGATQAAQEMIDRFLLNEERLNIYPWFGRVPSHSNVADDPSRLSFSARMIHRCKRVPVSFPAHYMQWG